MDKANHVLFLRNVKQQFMEIKHIMCRTEKLNNRKS
jgi:hypothetical protein